MTVDKLVTRCHRECSFVLAIDCGNLALLECKLLKASGISAIRSLRTQAENELNRTENLVGIALRTVLDLAVKGLVKPQYKTRQYIGAKSSVNHCLLSSVSLSSCPQSRADSPQETLERSCRGAGKAGHTNGLMPGRMGISDHQPLMEKAEKTA